MVTPTNGTAREALQLVPSPAAVIAAFEGLAELSKFAVSDILKPESVISVEDLGEKHVRGVTFQKDYGDYQVTLIMQLGVRPIPKDEPSLQES